MAIENVIQALAVCGIGSERDDKLTLADILSVDSGYEETDEFKDLEILAPLAQFYEDHYKERNENLRGTDERPTNTNKGSKKLSKKSQDLKKDIQKI